MIGVSKFKRKLEEIVKEMEKLNVRKVWSSSLHKNRKNNFKVSKRFLKDMIDKINQIKKQNLLITDLPNDEARFIFKDITEGSIVINSYSNDIILGAKI
ncbi:MULTISPECIES: hypothetical protein [Fusobacterium]|jgi:hypothetical protein|uniref:Uncharacterized protein n=1 Tax=Fusobacterium nucleatum TaxID=851 RepID=A0A323TY90_FUSNU|nr:MULTISPECIES: hypothetical protein [Fusobacterium]PCR86173.1 hypothetical protein CQA79_00200 [Fusobacterium nucleatum]PZA05505.1 hypothetical protein DNF10_01285 [Fusobacterium nucleatum]QJX50247.1 hypothetical protein HOO60_04960 [Fusobacterium nucleatum]HCE33107.1 hypothetical protein [Fusobacterium sp.]